MNLRKLYLIKNNCYITGKTITPKGIMVHSTGANNPNLRRYVGPDDGPLGNNPNNNHWNQPLPEGRQVCVHGFIGKLADGSIATYQTLPWNMRGWHCGSGTKGSGNDTHISFEICEDGLTDAAYFAKVYQEAVELCAYLCKEYSLDPLADGVLICHSEGCRRGIASNHADVMHWFPKHGKSMDTFRADVRKLLGTAQTLFRVQCGAFTIRSGADILAAKLQAKQYQTYLVMDGGLYKVQIGAFTQKENSDALVTKLQAQGFDTYITTKAGVPVA